VGKTGIIHIHSTHIQVEMDNPYPIQIPRVWIWIRVVGIQWQLDFELRDAQNVQTLYPRGTCRAHFTADQLFLFFFFFSFCWYKWKGRLAWAHYSYILANQRNDWFTRAPQKSCAKSVNHIDVPNRDEMIWTGKQASYTQSCISGVLGPTRAWQPFSYRICVGVIDRSARYVVVGFTNGPPRTNSFWES